jgi:hypothetical protein
MGAMATKRRIQVPVDALFSEARKKPVPFEFVLDELAPLDPYTKPLFGCTAVYVEDQIVFALRERPSHPEDNGVWVATTREHHDALRAELPSLRSIGVLAGGAETGWQILPADAPGFEDEVVRACALVQRRDPRIGKVPKAKRPAAPRRR